MSRTVFKHSEYELRKLGLHLDGQESSKKILRDTLSLIRRFERQEHTDFTAQWTVDFFTKLANFAPLSPITDDPEEWEHYKDSHENLDTGKTEITERWMSKRCPWLFSLDEGKTYTDMKDNNVHTSANHIELAAQWERQRQERMAARIAADQPQHLQASVKPPVDTSTPAGEDTTVTSRSKA